MGAELVHGFSFSRALFRIHFASSNLHVKIIMFCKQDQDMVATNVQFCRGLLRGIARFAHTNSDWAVQYEEWTAQDNLPNWLTRGKFQGVLCRVHKD